jgi:regulator of sigma E protease
MQLLKPVFIFFEVLVLFNLLIFVHELGHFLAARWRGLKIERFAIWFGKPLWKTTINGVEYVLGSIPAGGYVSLPQMATMETIEGKTEGSNEPLPPISAMDKIIVAFAGPLFSFGLALAFAVIVWQVGRPVTEAETSTTVGHLTEKGPADQAGIKVGDKIVSVDGHKVTKFGGMGDSITWRVVRSEGATIPIDVMRNGELKHFDVPPLIEKTGALERKALREVQVFPAEASIIGRVASNSPAALAHLQMKDEVVAVNGQKPLHYAEVAKIIDQAPGEKVNLTVNRDGNVFEAALQPQIPVNAPDDDKKPRLGIEWLDGGKTTIVKPEPIEQVVGSVNAMISTFDALFARKSDIKAQHLGGAIKILSVYYLLFQHEDGWRLALWFSVLMNVNLALLNLLPFPVLDGGHITLAVLEALRRKPISARILNYVQTGCAVVLISYMLYIAFYDIQDLGGKKSREMQFAPPKEMPVPAQ